MATMNEGPSILYLPDVALEKIFSFFSYDEIAKNRLVCRKFNEVGSHLLSRGFIQLEKRHVAIYKRVKSLLPRRESERKVHPLHRHCDILQAVETRMNMLNMTYMKYIESGLLCFIPGKVLDEIINVLNLVECDAAPPRTHQILQELRDLSSMAMEHFDEHIFPRIKEHKERMEQQKEAALIKLCRAPSRCSKPVFTPQQTYYIKKLKRQLQAQKNCMVQLSRYMSELVKKIEKQNKRLKIQAIKLKKQEREIQEHAQKIQGYEAALSDIKKHSDECDQKYKDLTSELVRVKEDCVLKRSKPPTDVHHSLSSFIPNIKPRMASVFSKNYVPLSLDLERKRKSNLLPEIPVKMSKNSESQDEITTDVDRLIQTKNEENSGKSNFSWLIENIVKTPLTGIKSRKRKMTEDIDLN